MLLLVASPALSADSWLYAIDGVKDPHGVAIAPGGQILVSSPIWNVIHLLDARGQKIRDFQADFPSAIASDSEGRIYIGLGKYSSGDIARQLPGEVRIYDANMNYIRSLGKGPGEFVMPSSVAVDQSGRILVSDMVADNVKVFDHAGTLLFTIGQHGIGDKSFNMPQAVAVDGATGFIYVADRQLIANTYGAVGNTPGARVQVFDAAGNYKAGFGSIDKLRSPSGIAVRNGRVFVSDSLLDVIVVYTVDGVFVGNIASSAVQLSVAGPIAISADGLMYVSGDNSNNVHVFGVDNYMSFDVTPRTLSYDAYEGSAASVQSIVIENKGGQNVQWTAASSVAWAVPAQLSGNLAPSQTVQSSVSVDPAGLAQGTYQGRVDVSNQNGTALSVALTLNVKPRPALNVTPSSLSFSTAAGSVAVIGAPVTVGLSNASMGAFIQATSDTPWLSASPSRIAAVGSGNIAVSVNPAGLVAGQYTGHINVGASDAVSSTAVVTVSLTVTSVGTIMVESNVAGSAFEIDGDNNVALAGGGSRWAKIGVPDGVYKIVFRPLAGYQKPKDQMLTLSGQGTITFDGTYRSTGQSRKLIVGVGSRPANTPSLIGIFDADGTKISEFAPFGSEYHGVLNVTSADINGDGLDEIIVGSGSPDGKARVAVFDGKGQPLAGADFLAFDSINGVRVSAGDVDGDGMAEIVAVSGQGCVNAASVKIFKYIDGVIKDTGAAAQVYNSPEGASVVVADFTGDGKAEIVVAPASNSGARPILRQLAVDSSAGAGKWQLQDTGVVIKIAANYVSGIAAADMNGDGIAELVVASVLTSGNVTSSKIDMYKGDGTSAGKQISLGSASVIEVAAGDINADGIPELCAAISGNTGGTVLIRIFRSDGSVEGEIQLSEYTGSVAKMTLGQLY